MTHRTREDRPPGGRGDLSGNTSCAASDDVPPIAPNAAHPQAKVLRLVRPPRPRRIDVTIAARAGAAPIGRTRPLKITESDLEQLIEFVLRLERARA
jgi:hypothetical protein